jgi:hypothetical protein
MFLAVVKPGAVPAKDTRAVRGQHRRRVSWRVSTIHGLSRALLQAKLGVILAN